MMDGEELQLLQEEAQASTGAPAWSRKWLLWPVVGLLAVAGFAGGARRWLVPEAENLRGVVNLQYLPPCDQATPPTTVLPPCPQTPVTLPALPSVPQTLPAALPGVPAPVPGIPAILPTTTPCPEAVETVPTPPKEDPGLKVGHMDRKEAWELTWAHDDDDVEVRWLMSPLLKEKLGRTAAFFGLYHVGVGFHNTRTGLDSSVEFAAKKFGVNLVVPSVERESNKINWDSAAELITQEGKLDTGYWVERKRVATIKGADYNKLLKWLPDVQKANSNYFLLNLAPLGQQLVQPHLPKEPSADGFPPGAVTCSDVAQLILDQIKQIAGSEAFNMDCTDIGRSDAYLWVKPGTKPRKLDMSAGSEDFEKAMHFFEVLKKALSGMANADSYPLQRLASDASQTLQDMGLPEGIYVDAHWDYWSYEVAERFAGARKSETPDFAGAPE